MSLWVVLEPPSSTVEAGGSTSIALRIRNTGDIVEEYHVDVVGDPALWCEIEQTSVRLYPGTTGTVRLTFSPPRSPDSAAGPHPFAVRVTPVEHHEAVQVPEGNLTVTPFVDIRAELLPVTVRGWRRGKPRLVVDNYGNTTATAAVNAAASGSQVDFDIRTPSLQVPPGRAYFSVLRLRPQRLHWFGQKVNHPFITTLQLSGSEPVATSGTFVQTALLPRWMTRMLAGLMALLAFFVALWLTIHPSVASSATAQAVSAPTDVAKASPTATPPFSPPPTTQAPTTAAAGGGGAPTTAAATAATPVGEWLLNETGGTVAADSVGSHNGAATNGWFGQGSGLICGGSSSKSQVVTNGPVLSGGPSASFTVAAWVYLGALQDAETAVSEDASTNSSFELQYVKSSNTWAFSRDSSDVGSPSTVHRATSNVAPVLKTWTYLAGVFDGSTGSMTLYVNGQAQNTVTDPTPYSGTGAFAICRGQQNGSSTDWFYGGIRDVEAFNVALSPGQVSALSPS